MPKEDYERLEILSKSSIRSDFQLKNYKSDAKNKIGDLEKSKKGLEAKIESLEQKNTHLEREKQLIESDKIRQQRNAVVYKSILEDKEPDLKISESEFKGRLILHNLERDSMPKDKAEGQNWLEILEENKINKTIPQNRLGKL